MTSRNIQTLPKIKLMSSAISRKSLKRLYRRTARFRFVGLSVATATLIFLLSSFLPSAKAMACVAGFTAGFFCSTITRITAQAPFDGNNAIVLQTIFLAINVIIAVRILWKGYQAWSAREAGEEYQSTINGIIMGLGVLYALEFVANKIVGE